MNIGDGNVFQHFVFLQQGDFLTDDGIGVVFEAGFIFEGEQFGISKGVEVGVCGFAVVICQIKEALGFLPKKDR